MNEDNFSINVSWNYEWYNIPKAYLVEYYSPEAELKNADEAYELCDNETTIGREMLESIGINFKDDQ